VIPVPATSKLVTSANGATSVRLYCRFLTAGLPSDVCAPGQ